MVSTHRVANAGPRFPHRGHRYVLSNSLNAWSISRSLDNSLVQFACLQILRPELECFGEILPCTHPASSFGLWSRFTSRCLLRFRMSNKCSATKILTEGEKRCNECEHSSIRKCSGVFPKFELCSENYQKIQDLGLTWS